MTSTSAPPNPSDPQSQDNTVADAASGNWVDTYAPRQLRPYLRLARADRPIGVWLLLFPCWWSLCLALIAHGHALETVNARFSLSQALWFALLFAIGSFVMRGAGCAFNDYVDRDYDAQVARTKSRPIPSGQVSPKSALVFVVALSLVGLAVLVQFNRFTIWLAIASLALVAVYPFMKRYTYWPQVVLGLTFNWGALVGWSAVHGSLSVAPILLYLGCVAWTVAYDTIYAHQDKEDDLSLGLKSTAIRFGDATQQWLVGLYMASVICFAGAAILIPAPFFTYISVLAVAGHFVWQDQTLDINDADNCLARFKSNRFVGWILLAGLVLDAVFVQSRLPIL
ncbi:MAG: 4-hydroxybenzoate octaprenyltransferase [Filomicrobium sp.]